MQLLKLSLKIIIKRVEEKWNFWENPACEIKCQTFKSTWRFESRPNESVRVEQVLQLLPGLLQFPIKH